MSAYLCINRKKKNVFLTLHVKKPPQKRTTNSNLIPYTVPHVLDVSKANIYIVNSIKEREKYETKSFFAAAKCNLFLEDSQRD